ncbi:MAG TPA: hypothetical protein VF877_05855 [Gaiellaceae bacterium]
MLQQALLVLRRLVLEVSGEVAEVPGRRDRLDGVGPAGAFQLRELRLELPFLRKHHRLWLLVGH